MGKTRDLFKKIRAAKGTFHVKMGTIMDRNVMDLTEAEDNKRWQEYWSRLPFPTPDGEISITSDNVDDTTPVAESEEELKSPLMKVK